MTTRRLHLTKKGPVDNVQAVVGDASAGPAFVFRQQCLTTLFESQ